MEQKTTAPFIVNGLDGHPQFNDAARSIHFSQFPDSIFTLEDRLMEEDASIVEHSAIIQ